NRMPRAYHSGDSAEVDWLLRRFSGPVDVIGVSLGGNALLKWLGEHAREAAQVVPRAAALSAPLDLAAAGGAPDPRLHPPGLPRQPEAEIARAARAIPRSLRSDHAARLAYLPRVRQRLHGAAARISRRRSLLDVVLQRAVARAHRGADARAQRTQRPVPAGGSAARRDAQGGAVRVARIAAHRRPCRLSEWLAIAPPDQLLPFVKLPAEIFRTYDIRGIVGSTLTADVVREIGRALGSLGRERNAPTFAV